MGDPARAVALALASPFLALPIALALALPTPRHCDFPPPASLHDPCARLTATPIAVHGQVGDIEVEPLATRRHIESWSDLGTAFAAEDAVIERRAQAAAAKGCTLRYVQRIDCPTPAVLGGERATQVNASIRLEEVPLDHPHAMVKVRVEQ